MSVRRASYAADYSQPMPLPAVGLFLNAYPVSCSGSHRFSRFPLPEGDWSNARRERERSLGQPVVIHADAAWVIGEHPDGETVEVACDEQPQLHQFLLRDALQRQAADRNFDTWFGFGGELWAVQRGTFAPVGPILVEPLLKSRFTHEGAMGGLVVLVIRWQVRWRFSGDLADPQLAEWGAGESAVRIEGDGPRRGRIVEVADDVLRLELRGGEVREVASQNYALVARPALVQRFLRTNDPANYSDIYRQLQVASGTLEPSGRRNRYQVKEREQKALARLRRPRPGHEE